MVSGWAGHAGDRHHGAHGDLVSRHLNVPVGELLDFSQNINPIGAPRDALEAARAALYEESGRYPDLEYRELRVALAAYLEVSADSIVPTNGGAEALFLAAGAARAGKALVLEPTFSEYAAAARASGREVLRRVARRPGEDFGFDRGSLEDLRGISIVFLCNPNNPTGDSLGRREVLELASRVREAGAVLVVDEAFADFTPGISVAALVDEHLWVARSFTKFFAIPGLRLGCLVCDDPGRIKSLQPSWPVNAVAAAAGIAAASDNGFADTSVAGVARLRKDLFAALDALAGLRPFPGAANFLLVRGPDWLPERLAHRGVLVRGCSPFMGLGPEYFRVAVRGEAENGRLVAAIREEL
ncbi:MAG: pyridoxal phosphate-dependent class II aminotransferase [Rubrobacteraceae bacterium]|nr:pyridoxal phosphate-dependent class II aminotransferase [Rubrobacteraceae bacterium]